METWSSFLLIAAFISTFITFAIYIYALVKVRQHNPLGSQRRGALQLVFGLFPVFALTSLCGIIIPRAAYSVEWGQACKIFFILIVTFCKRSCTTYSTSNKQTNGVGCHGWVGERYLAITIYSFLGLVTEYFGGTAAMMKFFEENKVSYAQPPFACCCVCLPEVYMNERKFKFNRYLVLQVIIVRPLCVFIGAVLWSDSVEENSAIQNTDTLNFWLGTVAGFSTGIAVYGIQVFSKSSNHYLKQYYVRIKLTVVLLVLILTSTVAFVLDVMSFAGSIPCQPSGPFSSRERAQTIYNHVTIHLMALTICGIFCFWIWLSKFSDNKDDVELVPVVPSPGGGNTPVENHSSADQTATVIVDTQGTLTVDKQTNDTQSDQQDTQTDDKQDTQTDGKQDTQTVENHNSADQTATEIVDTQGTLTVDKQTDDTQSDQQDTQTDDKQDIQTDLQAGHSDR
ncbi:putative organic solute transporter subunit alpha [Apostichopus japonicus]|uniref:Putative organic solute transporter subunit alpha n=1 Tax=Stichopus japonicus TaxID=307972 RepID=A0A2G8JUH8_STIJA|nr:putative organic solute transporter subunit alpha [Apostichopus japonicus]